MTLNNTLLFVQFERIFVLCCWQAPLHAVLIEKFEFTRTQLAIRFVALRSLIVTIIKHKIYGIYPSFFSPFPRMDILLLAFFSQYKCIMESMCVFPLNGSNRSKSNQNMNYFRFL